MMSWYGKVQWTRLLLPISCLFAYVANKKRTQYLANKPQASSVPVVVVGNITVGGTGKTPLVQTLVRLLKERGFRPGIISRGYGASIQRFPHLIQDSDTSEQVGDEPYMLHRSLAVPVVIDPKRKIALERISQLDVDVVISDDGMQHYALPRDIEICVLDGVRGMGNACLLPVGPLREPVQRLKTVDFVLHSGKAQGDESFDFLPVAWVNVKTGEKLGLNDFKPKKEVIAIAGIGNPQKFQRTLMNMNIHCPLKSYPDHYAYKSTDFVSMAGQIIMTEKDAVKISPFASDNMWYLQIQAQVSPSFVKSFFSKLNQCLELRNG